MKRKLKIIFILVLSLILFTFCGSKPKKENVDVLYSNKTEYTGDASKVIQIVYNLDYGKGIEPSKIEIQSKQEPYILQIYLENGKNIDEKILLKNSVVIFSLVKNLSEIKYIEKNGKIVKEFSRENIEKTLLEKENKNLDEIAKSKEELGNYLIK